MDDTVFPDEIFDALFLVVGVTFHTCFASEASESTACCFALSNILVLENPDFVVGNQNWFVAATVAV